MDTSLGQYPEQLRVVVTALSVLAALLPALTRLSISKSERLLLAITSGIIVFLTWPVEFSYCEYESRYANSALILLLVTAVFSLLSFLIVRHFGHSQTIRSDETVVTSTILGGPILSSAASDIKNRSSHASTQQIFEELGHDPLMMWERWPRTLVIVTHRSLVFLAILSCLVALAHALAFFDLKREVRVAHRALSLAPSGDRIALERKVFDIIPSMHECNPSISWTIEGPEEKEGSRSGLLGMVTPTGTYISPEKIERDAELFVVATPVQHPAEFKKVKFILRAQPDYAQRHFTEVPTGGEIEKFEVQVIDPRYSWIIGKNVIGGEGGSSLVKRMAADGLFSGFQDIVCVGAASREIETRELEEKRALERSTLLANWLLPVLSHPAPRVWALKIGRYNDDVKLSPEETAGERRLVIVGVNRAGRGSDMLGSLRKAFSQMRKEEPVLGMYLDKYPGDKWVLQEVTK